MDKKSRKFQKLKKIADKANKKGDTPKIRKKFEKTLNQIDGIIEQKHSPMKKYGNGYAMKMGSKEINSPSAFNMKDAMLINQSPMMAHIAGHDPKNKDKKRPTTSLKNALASDEDYQIVPGYEERLGGELEGVTVVANYKKPEPPKKKKYKKPFRRTDVGRALGDVGDAIGGIFQKKHKTKFGTRGIARGGVKPRGANRYQRKVSRR